MLMEHRLNVRHILAGTCLVAAGALAVGVVTANGPNPAHRRSLGSHGAKVELASSVSNALASVKGDISYIHTTVTNNGTGAVIVSTSKWVAPNGDVRLETFAANGTVLTDETISPSGAAKVIDYPRREWWTVTSAGTIGSFDVHQVLATVQSGVLAPSGHQRVEGTEYLVLRGTPAQMGPGGGTVTLLVNPTTYLPASLTADEGQATVKDQLRWPSATSPANMAALSSTVPPGFTHLSSPPSGLSTGGAG